LAGESGTIVNKKVAEAQREYPLRFRFFDLYCLNCHLKLFCPGIHPRPFRLPDFRQLPFQISSVILQDVIPVVHIGLMDGDMIIFSVSLQELFDSVPPGVNLMAKLFLVVIEPQNNAADLLVFPEEPVKGLPGGSAAQGNHVAVNPAAARNFTQGPVTHSFNRAFKHADRMRAGIAFYNERVAFIRPGSVDLKGFGV